MGLACCTSRLPRACCKRASWRGARTHFGVHDYAAQCVQALEDRGHAAALLAAGVGKGLRRVAASPHEVGQPRGGSRSAGQPQ